MKMILTVTKDVITGEATNSPNISRNDADAKRSWGNAIAELCEHNPTKIPIKDLQLYKVGIFDTETLEITPCTEYLCSAQEFIKE